MAERRGDTRCKCIVFVRSVAQVRCFFFSLRNTGHNLAGCVRSCAQLSAGMCTVERRDVRSGAQWCVAQYQGACSVRRMCAQFLSLSTKLCVQGCA